MTAAAFAIGRRSYPDVAPSVAFAIIATQFGAFAIRPDGTLHADQTRRLPRLARHAKRVPTTADGWIRLAALNMSAVAISSPILRPSVVAAVRDAVEIMQREAAGL